MPPTLQLYGTIYVVTGVASSVIAQKIFYAGLTDKTTLLLPFTTYLGMFLVVLLPERYFSASNAAPSEAPESALSASSPRTSHVGHDASPLLTPELTSPPPPTLAILPPSSPSPAPSDSSRVPSIGGQPLPAICLKLNINGILYIMISLDFVGTILSLIGLQLCGSGLHTVVMSGVVCWSSLLSYFFLKKKSSPTEFGALVIIVMGLIFSAAAQTDHSSVMESLPPPPPIFDFNKLTMPVGNTTTLLSPILSPPFLSPAADHHEPSFAAGATAMHQVWLGMLITMLSSWLFALNYICAETIQAFKNAPSSKFLCEKIGLYDLLLCLVYMLFHTLPNWERLVTLPVKAAGGDPVVILPYMILAILSAMVHMVTYFWIVKNSGAVSVGVMKSFQAVSTFVVSAYLFCGEQESQCFTLERGIATLLVSMGVVIYSFSKKKKSKKSKKKGAKTQVGEEGEGGSPSHSLKKRHHVAEENNGVELT